MLTALQAQCSEVPLSVKTPAGLASPFSCSVGLEQGEPSSPDLFGFYIDDLPHCIEALGPDAALPNLQGCSVPPLLYADDVAIHYNCRPTALISCIGEICGHMGPSN